MPQKFAGTPLPAGAPYLQEKPAKNFLQDSGLTGFSAALAFFGKTPPKACRSMALEVNPF